MSEALAGIPPAPRPGKPHDAAAVILFRRGPHGVEVFWVRRGLERSFAGGFYAFPGGRVDAGDLSVAVRGAQGQDAVLRATAARELFEEAGVLVAEGAEGLAPERLSELRRELLDSRLTLGQALDRYGLRLRKEDLAEAGRWVTPPFSPLRYDARFFLVEAPPGAQAELWPGELAGGGWIRPADALKLWEEGKALLHPPNLHALQTMADFSTPERALAKLREPPHCPNFIATRIEFQRGIRLFPLETPTLPPATHTNVYILGNGELLVVDPGAAEVRQYARLLALLAGLKAEGKRPKAVLLTHHHQDHVGGAAAVSQRLGVPIWCHERTAERASFQVQRLLKDGDDIKLAGTPTLSFKVLNTPGHARGHVCLVEQGSKAAIVGDMVAGVGTIVIDPPEGDMGEYVEQLRRLKELPVGALYPAHGPVIANGPAKLVEYLRHREQRERQVLEAVPLAGATLQEIVPKAYADVDEAIFPIAERSAHAILIKLVREGRLSRKDDRYFPPVS